MTCSQNVFPDDTSHKCKTWSSRVKEKLSGQNLKESLCALQRPHILHPMRQLKRLPNGRILDLSKLDAFVHNKIICDSKMDVYLGKTRNIEGKGENAGYQLFLFFPHLL